ncbi:TPA: phage tail assembly chaperone [Serratia marcescens]|uniref:phage tail assembly chaperone n=1 Tax=Serratia TaxID=613 RepID=UPI0036D20CEF
MMAEFTLNPTPTFSIDVVIPRAGSEDGILTFSFKHKKRSQLETLEKSLREATEQQLEAGSYNNEPMADFLHEICDGWALPDMLNRESIITLLDNYPRAFDAIATAYTKELMVVREKN